MNKREEFNSVLDKLRRLNKIDKDQLYQDFCGALDVAAAKEKEKFFKNLFEDCTAIQENLIFYKICIYFIFSCPF